MLDKANLERIRAHKAATSEGRREIIKCSGDALNASKRAIFSLHRGDMAGADALLKEADTLFSQARERIAKNPSLDGVGAYRAGLEEFTEASLYRQYAKDGSVGTLDYPDVDDDIYLGGLCDLVGELQRRQVKAATDGDMDAVVKIKEVMEDIVSSLLAIDLEGYLRTKFDQAKNAMRRAEDVLYDVKLRMM
jgi:predicted translin family RNA/ssDNA-binding protein